MPTHTVKLAVSIPEPLARAVEEVRRVTGQSRSAVFAEALAVWFRGRREADRVAEYVAGYKAQPETPQEIAAFERAAAILAAEEWD